MKRFDTDGDGKLSEEEREKLRERMQQYRDEMIKRRFDRDGDGKLNDDEQAALDKMRKQMQQRREEFMKRYDKDGDGQLSQEERRRAMADRGGRGRGRGQGQGSAGRRERGGDRDSGADARPSLEDDSPDREPPVVQPVSWERVVI